MSDNSKASLALTKNGHIDISSVKSVQDSIPSYIRKTFMDRTEGQSYRKHFQVSWKEPNVDEAGIQVGLPRLVIHDITVEYGTLSSTFKVPVTITVTRKEKIKKVVTDSITYKGFIALNPEKAFKPAKCEIWPEPPTKGDFVKENIPSKEFTIRNFKKAIKEGDKTYLDVSCEVEGTCSLGLVIKKEMLSRLYAAAYALLDPDNSKRKAKTPTQVETKAAVAVSQIIVSNDAPLGVIKKAKVEETAEVSA